MGKELPMHIRTTCFLQEAQYVETWKAKPLAVHNLFF